MIKKLRLKFVVLSMSLLFLMLAIIISAINVLNYNRIVNDADSTLRLLSSNDGKFPDEPDKDISGFDKRHIKELPYESRYFFVGLDSDGNTLFSDTGKIAAIDTETAIEYAKEIWEDKNTKGFIDEYRYILTEDNIGYKIFFLDCGRNLDSMHSFLFISVGISLTAFVIVSVLLLLLSSRIVRPISESYEKQAQFITNASHDLKTPLTIISADVDILEMDYGESEWFDDIKNQVKQLTNLTNNLVILSKMEEENSSLNMIDFPLSDVVSEAVASFESLAIAKGQTLNINIEPMISLCGDEKAIRQLVSILLDNAIKYSTGNIISLKLEKINRSAQLTVTNYTESIEKNDLKHLFDRFYRTDKSRNSMTGGHGIGLSVAKAICTAHKGSITAQSPQSNLISIIVKLPII